MAEKNIHQYYLYRKPTGKITVYMYELLYEF